MTILAIESMRQFEQVKLDAQKTSLERNILGQFATPNNLALEIVRYAKESFGFEQQINFLEPAFGTGSFYSALTQSVGADQDIHSLGIELDQRFYQAACSLWKGLNIEFLRGDFTKLEPESRFNLLITNPPYVRHHHINSEDKQHLTNFASRRFGINVSGLSGLYCHFIYKAHDWLAQDALSVWLIPSEFMDVNYGGALKEYLTTWVTLEQIHRFSPGDAQFTDALVSSAVVIFRNRRPDKNHKTLMTFGGHLREPKRFESISISTLSTTRKWTSVTHYHEKPLQELEGLVLGDLFKVKRGLATGSNKFFILERNLAESFVPTQYLKPILPSSRHLAANVVETTDDGYPDLKPQLAIIDCDLTGDVLRIKYPEFWKYLERGIKTGIDKGYLASNRKTWYSQEFRSAAPLICTYMGRPKVGEPPFRFILNRSKAIATNVYLMLYPNDNLTHAMRLDSKLGETIVKILNEVSEQSFLNEGRVYGGGLHKMEPKELMRLPLTDPILTQFAMQPSLL